MECKICDSESTFFATAPIFGKQIQYFRCNCCGFIQTEKPFWLEQAYKNPISCLDVGLLARNQQLQNVAGSLLKVFFDKSGEFLDFGGGRGVFVRLMRDAGFRFYYYDKYPDNIFASDFDQRKNQQFELLTAFEVFEHLAEPCQELERMLNMSKNILFSTELLPEPAPLPKDWWYYGLEHGQHVALYSKASLKRIALKYALQFYTNGRNIHLLTEKNIFPPIFRLATSHFGSKFINRLIRIPSLLNEDAAKARLKLAQPPQSES